MLRSAQAWRIIPPMRQVVARLGGAAIAMIVVVAIATAASAQDRADGPEEAATLASARASFDAANFSGAVRALTTLLERGTLDAAELTRALELLALSSRGAGDDDSLERALLLLSLVEGADDALASSPPSLRQRFARVRAQRDEPRLTLDAREDGDVLVVRAEVSPELPHTTVRVHGRRGDGEWEQAPRELRLSLEAPVEYYATLELAGVPLRESARETHAQQRIAVVPELALRTTEDEASGDDSGVWWAVGSLAAAAAIG
ncbi:MAG: hypothetical protein M3Y87_08700, partial [Myxococcota bacterium]|nr:hypothetical protein [Myxococcota bacterium]